MKEATTAVDGGRMYYRHSDIDVSRPTIVFVHGLGESGLCFLEALHEPLLEGFNIVVPDLLGFGKSSAALDGDYAFSQQITHICRLLDGVGVHRVDLVGHSMGGDIGTLFCQQYRDRINRFVNIEGDLTPDDRFITNAAIQAERDGRFQDWLREDFPSQQVLSWCQARPSCIRYLASLRMCQTRAFLASVREIYGLNEGLPDSNVGLIGKTYLNLDVPRVYCWGMDSLSKGSQAFLAESTLSHKAFPDAGHWVMLDQPVRFYSFLAGFLATRTSG